MNIKVCSRCKQAKSTELFHKNRNRSFGVHEYCKECRKQENPQAAKRSKLNYQNNKEVLLEKMAAYYQQNKESKQAYGKEHYRNNKIKYVNKAAKRRAQMLLATPKWVSEEEEFFILEAYELAALRTKVTGFKWEVDHYYPLKGKTVCGLHCIENLQVIPKTLNNKKRNQHPEDFGDRSLFYATKK